jgi:uncharacterized membrane protein YqaE (UPF0057 family)
MTFAEIILAIFFPPIAVLLRFGLTGKFGINILLTMLGWLPGVIHAFISLSKKPKASHA